MNYTREADFYNTRAADIRCAGFLNQLAPSPTGDRSTAAPPNGRGLPFET
jgi:hypothetical protein